MWGAQKSKLSFWQIKGWTNFKTQLFLVSFENRYQRQMTAWKLKEALIQTVTSYQMQKLRSKRAAETSNGRRTDIVIHEFLGARCALAWELNTAGTSLGKIPHFCEFYIQEPSLVLTVKIEEKSLCTSSEERKDHSFWNPSTALCFFSCL